MPEAACATAPAGGESIILIPARIGSTRFPRKPLADLGGRPMIVEVARRAQEAGIGRAVVATDDAAIAEAVRGAGFEAVLTADTHESGSDRIFEALGKLSDVGGVRFVVNVQGDLPTIDPALIRRSAEILAADPAVDIATFCTVITDQAEIANPNVVKVVGSRVAPDRLRALYFTRATCPWGEGPLYHHIGLYAYRREALARFVAAPASELERRERLEQLRALEMGMRIDVALVDTMPLGVDTPEDLERARAILEREAAQEAAR